MKEIFNEVEIRTNSEQYIIGSITEKDKFNAAKQILLGIAVLYVITLIVCVLDKSQSAILLEMCKMTFPPLVTLILTSYFHDKH